MLNLKPTNKRPLAAACRPRSIGWSLLIGCLLSSGGPLARGADEAGEPTAAEVAAQAEAVQAAAEAAKKAMQEKRAALMRERAAVQQRLQAQNAQNAQAQANAVAQQWRPVLLAELSFVRLVCPDLPRPQRARVKAAGERALLAAMESGVVHQRPANNVGNAPTPQSLIREALSKTLREALPPDEWKHFTAESEARVKRRQEALVLLVVQRLDESLYLSSEQCDQIGRELTNRWQNIWEGWLQLGYMQNIPDLPLGTVTPFLDAQQRKTFEKMPKMALSAMPIRPGNAVADDPAWWEEVDPADKDEAAGVPPP